MTANSRRYLLFIIRRTPVIMLAIVFISTKTRAPKRAAIEVGRPAERKERCWRGCGFSRVLEWERLILDASDKKCGTSHMTVVVDGALGAKSGHKDCRNQRPMSLNIELGCSTVIPRRCLGRCVGA
jgi:hypothetical protein